MCECLLADELEDELLGDNGRVLLQSIAEDLRANVPPDAMLPSETAAYSKVLCLNTEQVLQRTVHC